VETFVVHTTQIVYLVTVSPTKTPTSIPSSPTHTPTKGAETYVNFKAIITLTGLSISSTSTLVIRDSRYLTSKLDTASLLSYVVYTLLGLTSSSTVNAMLVEDGSGAYLTTFNVSILAESMGYTADSVNVLYSNCISILTDSVSSGTFISTIKSVAVDWGYSDFGSVSTLGNFYFTRNSTIYGYTIPPTIVPSIGRFDFSILNLFSVFAFLF